jgi:quinoprotein relay system zinc metallohydrolase 2
MRLFWAFIIIGVALLPSNAGPMQIKPLQTTEIAPGVYAYQGEVALMNAGNQGSIANLGFIIGTQAVAVIDTGGSVQEGLALRAAIITLTDKPIRYVINTHVHPDHLFGNAAFAGATFIGHKNLPRALATRGPYYLSSFRNAMGAALLDEVKLIPPSRLVEDTLKLDLGDREIILKAWKSAHTDCDLTVFDTKTATLFAGDLVFLQHLPVIDASLLGWISVFDELAALPAKRVVPGHGPIEIDWPDALKTERTYFDKLAKDLRAMIARNATIAEAAEQAGQSEADKWKLFSDYNARNATAAFKELEWE